MTSAELSSTPNQKFHTVVDGNRYDFELRTIRGMLYCSTHVNGSAAVMSYRCVDRGWLIPFKHLTPDGGNFRFETLDGAYPSYEDFENGTCVLKHYTADEIAELDE